MESSAAPPSNAPDHHSGPVTPSSVPGKPGGEHAVASGKDRPLIGYMPKSPAPGTKRHEAGKAFSAQREARREPEGESSQRPRASRPDPRPPFQAGGRPASEVYAALDLGTNNCRLLVAKPRRKGFVVIDAFSRTVRLGEGMGAAGLLSAEAMERSIEALKICAGKMRRRGVTQRRAIATQACREAVNGPEFIARIEAETGIAFDIITAKEEATLAAIGCMPLADTSCDTALVFDIGGGSTELIWLDLRPARRPGRKPRIAAWTSLPCGVVTLAERYGSPHIAPECYGDMVRDVRALLDAYDGAKRLEDQFGSARVHMLGTSGTVTTLAGLSLGLERYDRAKVDGLWLDTAVVADLCTKLSTMSYEERADYPCIGIDRANLVLAGCAILEAILQRWPCPRLRVADRGLREGMLLAQMGWAERGGRHRGRRRRRGGTKPTVRSA